MTASSIGHIGVNNRGKDHVKRLAAATAAVCDVDQHVLAREKKIVTATAGKCDAYSDFRRLLDRQDIDAVVISTPDHWHALVAVAACQAGKDVYCEKPLALTIAEGRAIVGAARKYRRIVQTGSQQRSDRNFRYACELVRSGRLGPLQRIEVGLPQGGQAAGTGCRPGAARLAQLRFLAWSGSRAALQPDARTHAPSRLAVVVGLLRRPDDQLGLPSPRYCPVGTGDR